MREELAKQLAMLVAQNQQWEENGERKDPKRRKNRRTNRKSAGAGTWGLTCDGRRRNRTTEEHVQDLFRTPRAGSDTSTYDSWLTEKPNMH